MSHQDEILDQFTRQALPFSRKMAHADGLRLLVDAADTAPEDKILDVACGPGLVACAFAHRADKGSVTGLDLTPAMLAEADRRGKALGLTNLHWQLGSAYDLPYAKDQFSLVVSRYSFHHFDQPELALSEMIRVCQPAGRLIIADFAIAPESLAAFNRMEKLRDPSHVHAFSTEAFLALCTAAGLTCTYHTYYSIDMELESQLAASFPREGDADRIREMFRQDWEEKRNEAGMGIQVRMTTGTDGQQVTSFSYPIGVYVLEQ